MTGKESKELLTGVISDLSLRPGLDICFYLCYFIGAHFRLSFLKNMFRRNGASRCFCRGALFHVDFCFVL